MGLLDALAGRTRIADFAISFGDCCVSVVMEPLTRAIHPSVYIRWCCAYQAQILYNLGQGNPLSSDLLRRLGELAGSDFPPATDCVAESGFPFEYKTSIVAPTNQFTGAFYGKGEDCCWVQVKFPLRLVELQVGVSCFAVMQRSIELLQSREDREYLGRALCLLAVLWATSDTSSPQAITGIPTAAVNMTLEGTRQENQ